MNRSLRSSSEQSSEKNWRQQQSEAIRSQLMLFNREMGTTLALPQENTTLTNLIKPAINALSHYISYNRVNSVPSFLGYIFYLINPLNYVSHFRRLFGLANYQVVDNLLVSVNTVTNKLISENEQQGTELAEKDEKITSLESQLEKEKEKNKPLNEQNKQIPVLQEENEKQKQQLEEQKTSLEQITPENEQLKKQLDEKTNEVKQKDGEIEKLTKENTQLNEEITKHKEERLKTPLSTPVPNGGAQGREQKKTPRQLTPASSGSAYDPETSEGRKKIKAWVDKDVLPEIVFNCLDELVIFIHSASQEGVGDHQACVDVARKWAFDILRLRINCNDVFIKAPPEKDEQTAEFAQLWEKWQDKEGELKAAKINPQNLSNQQVNNFCCAMFKIFFYEQNDFLHHKEASFYFKQRGCYCNYVGQRIDGQPKLSEEKMQQVDLIMDDHYSKQPPEDTIENLTECLCVKDILKHDKLKAELAKDFENGRFFPQSKTAADKFKQIRQAADSLYQTGGEKNGSGSGTVEGQKKTFINVSLNRK